jgi:putative ABC transport system substrate-binding protein
VTGDRKTIRLALVGASSPDTAPKGLSAFWQRLRELGYVEGENLIVERRWADGQLNRLPALMNDVVAQKVDLILTTGTPAAVAAKKRRALSPSCGSDG